MIPTVLAIGAIYLGGAAFYNTLTLADRIQRLEELTGHSLTPDQPNKWRTK